MMEGAGAGEALQILMNCDVSLVKVLDAACGPFIFLAPWRVST